jgi:hypothetical protein
MTAKLTKRSAAEVEAEFNQIVPELATAIKALIRGNLPEELRAKPLMRACVTRDGAPSRRAKSGKLAPRA